MEVETVEVETEVVDVEVETVEAVEAVAVAKEEEGAEAKEAPQSRPRRDGAMKGVARFEACHALPSKLANARVAAGLSLESVPVRMMATNTLDARFEHRSLADSLKRKRAKEHPEKA